MNIMYRNTRGQGSEVTASQAILKGLADGGGLYVPTSYPKMDKSLVELASMDYKGVAYEVMKLFFTDYTEEELRGCIEKAYDEKFDNDEIAPMAEADHAYYLELFHGQTIAFKDMALSILPHLLTTAAKKNNQKDEIVILTATSGDTGKAALAGFRDVPGTKIIVFYPKNGVSRIQELQMVTEKGANTTVIGVDGNFDDCQTGVKKMFTNETLKKDRAAKPPKYYIFFKSRDKDTMITAFKEFVAKNQKKQQREPFKKVLQKFKDLSIRKHRQRTKEKNKTREQSL